MVVILPANGLSTGRKKLVTIMWLLSHYDRNTITGWAGLIRVDGTNYQWMGFPGAPQNVNQTSFSYTSTKSTFTMDVGGVVLTITFFSPITPNDLQRQSLPLSYMNVAVQSTDGNLHNVQLYADISAGSYYIMPNIFQIMH